MICLYIYFIVQLNKELNALKIQHKEESKDFEESRRKVCIAI